MTESKGGCDKVRMEVGGVHHHVGDNMQHSRAYCAKSYRKFSHFIKADLFPTLKSRMSDKIFDSCNCAVKCVLCILHVVG